MNHPSGKARQSAQAGGVIQIANERRRANLPQRADALGRRSQGKNAQAATQVAHGPQANIATTDDQQAFTTESSRQSSKGGLI